MADNENIPVTEDVDADYAGDAAAEEQQISENEVSKAEANELDDGAVLPQGSTRAAKSKADPMKQERETDAAVDAAEADDYESAQ